MTSLLIFSLLSGSLLIVYAYKKRTLPGARYFILLVASILFVNATYIGELNSNTLTTALFWSYLDHLVLPLHPYFWLMMCLDYTQTRQHRKIIQAGLGVYLAFYYFAFYTNSFLHLYITSYHFVSNGYFPVLFSDKGIGFLILIAMITVIGIASTLLYISGFFMSTQLHRRSYLLMLVASLFPWVTIYLNVSNTNYLGLDYYCFLMIVTCLLYLFAIFRYNIFSTIPIATETVYRLSEDAIALVDIDGRITDVNLMFLQYYPTYKRLSKTHTITDFLARHTELSGLSAENPKIIFQTQIDNSQRYLSAQLTQILSGTNFCIGSILSIKDITIYAEHQNQLKILAENAMKQAESNELSFLQAQISPHFINNTLSVISAMISRDDEKAKELVVDLSEYLISCYRVGNASPMAPLTRELEAVKTYIRIVKARFWGRVNFAADVEDLPNLELPRLVLQPLVENAVRHGIQPKKDGGTVHLCIHKVGTYACFEIQDDGVGIEAERISALLKGNDNQQGIGIINIHKRLLHYYGDGLHISGNRGTCVSFRIPLPKEIRKEEKADD
ncbi:MAG TPA: histidine kinase N-terminal 7TM domain-containing protein [Oscillospiraceae bacterium]|nr:histidine kinase N-terminal 7TM domain-containing protein [Oscillospiraceae bacterium]